LHKNSQGRIHLLICKTEASQENIPFIGKMQKQFYLLKTRQTHHDDLPKFLDMLY
jgi:hypothetical protein